MEFLVKALDKCTNPPKTFQFRQKSPILETVYEPDHDILPLGLLSEYFQRRSRLGQ